MEAWQILVTTLLGAGGLGGFVRWSAGRIASSWDALGVVIERNTNALIRNSEALGRVDVRVEEVGDRVVEIHDEISGVHSTSRAEEHTHRIVEPRQAFETKTPPKGTYHQFKRPATEPGRR